MGVYEQFETDFPKRTLKIIEQYERKLPKGRENYEVTLLVNCMLGLLVLPYQHLTDQIPNMAVDRLPEWSIESTLIRSWGRRNQQQAGTLRELVHRLRNGVAHLRIQAEGSEADITHLTFTDNNGFEARIPVANLRVFVKKLAATIIKEPV